MTARLIGRVLAVCALLAWLGGAARAQGVSPGKLARAHAALEGVDGCIKCHSGSDQVSASRCLACHQALAARIAANAGYHAKLGTDCASCHPDHRGVAKELVRWPGGDRDRFDHKTAGYELTGAHSKPKCRDCHKPAFQRGPIAGALTSEERPVTYLGLGTECAVCHADVHKPSLGTDCARCHDTKAWLGAGSAKAFDHGKTRYPLEGAHAKVACAKCHGGSAQKMANLHPKFDTCATCHADPHAAAMGKPPTACASCHQVSAWKDLRFDKATHPKTLPLVGAHATQQCAGCHGDKIDRKPAPACLGCHPDPHRPSLGTLCGSCHGVVAWTEATSAKPTFHDRTNYPLRGKHATVACKQCHDPKLPAARRYRPIKHAACLDCHADPHAGQASKPCAQCHAVDGWQPPRFELADHAATRFPLEGAHQATPCGRCHPAAPAAPRFDAGNPACDTCHADPHTGQFGQRACTSCHTTAAWAPSKFDKLAHAKTRLALVGGHDVPCAKCHTDRPAARFAGLSTACDTCHTDHHAGQFVGRACTECHAGAEWKPAAKFDHARTFPLRGQHAKAACARCHPKLTVALGPQLPFTTEVYRLGTTARSCTGCHRAQHGDPLSALELPRKLAAATRTCESCHTEASWRAYRGVAFDHATTGAPLLGAHTRAPCARCHQPGVRAIPKLAACAACHADRHGGRLGERCEACHSPTSWKQDQLLVDHQRTRLPLVGAHAVQGCPTCHVQAAAGSYRGLDPTCRGCHLHTVEERRPHPDHTRDLAFLGCQDCHSALGWRPASLHHDRFWPLTGKHVATPCARCHVVGAAFSAAPSACIGCHATNPVRPAMHDAMMDTAISGVTRCELCHTTTAWTGGQFAHPGPMQVPHRTAGSTCASCHPTPGMPQDHTCGGAPCHAPAKYDGIGAHKRRADYGPDCFLCHKSGGAG